MRKLLTSVLVMGAITASAQASEDDIATARVFALDTNVAAAKAFDNELARQVGFSLAITDTTQPRTVLCVYKTGGPEGLRIEFKYKNLESDDGQVATGKQIVHYQRITATDATMCKIFNYIFNTQVQTDQLRLLTSSGSPMKYKGGSYTYMLDQADYRPGYWELTFIR